MAQDEVLGILKQSNEQCKIASFFFFFDQYKSDKSFAKSDKIKELKAK